MSRPLSLSRLQRCASSVVVIKPLENSNVSFPLDTEIEFHPEADQSTFTYSLYGTTGFNRIGWFVPLIFPSMGNRRTATIPYLEPGYYELKVYSEFNRSYNSAFHYLGDTRKFHVNRRQLGFDVQYSSPPSSSYPYVETGSGGGSGNTSSSGGIRIPPGWPIALNVPITVSIYVGSPAASDIYINLIPIPGGLPLPTATTGTGGSSGNSGGAMSSSNPPIPNTLMINGQVNKTVTVKINAGQVRTNFVVTGLQEGGASMIVEARSHGYHDSTLQFHICHECPY